MFLPGLNVSPTMPAGTRVIVVDDDAITRGALAQLLQIWGYQPETASDGIEALEKVRSSRPMIVISDLRMPRMGGMEFLRALRSGSPGTHCIIITADGSWEAAAQARTLGVVDLLEKPVDLQRLQFDLKKCLEMPRPQA
jgi:DNA-binding NtrC family response regulator